MAANPRAKAPAATNDINFLMVASPELISLKSNTPDLSTSGIVVEYAAFARRFDMNLRSPAIFQLIPPATIN
ncbi:MAG TPA: hypothetical protein EYM34_06245 [Alphaproteobacteria bacterium]|nr:hypothetical protein [Alphaproteobacteria bacterium]